MALHYEGGDAENFLINLDNGWANRMTKVLEKVRFEKSQKTEIGDIIKIGRIIMITPPKNHIKVLDNGFGWVGLLDHMGD